MTLVAIESLLRSSTFNNICIPVIDIYYLKQQESIYKPNFGAGICQTLYSSQ